MAVTMTQIARHCGRSVSTVSNILRNGERAKLYSDETRQEVLDAAARLEYRPNFFAAQLQQQNRKLVMMAYGSLADTYAGAIANAFGRVITERGYMLMSAPLVQAVESGLLDSALGPHGLMTLAVIGYHSGVYLDDTTLDSFTRRGVQVVCVGRPVQDAPLVSQVHYDNDDGVRQVVEHFHAEGRRSVWLLGPDSGTINSNAHLARMVLGQRLLAAHGIETRLVPTQSDEPSLQGDAYKVVAPLLADGLRPDAILATSDPYAMGAMKAVKDAGLRVGPDVAICGFTGSDAESYLDPPLSSVILPTIELGLQSANLLLDLFEGKVEAGFRTMLPVRLEVRASSLR